MFVIIKKNPPRCLSPKKYAVPSSSRNIIVQVEEDGHMDIEYHHDQVNSMELEDDTNNIVEPDDGTNRLIQDIFAPIDEDDNFDDIHDIPLLEKAQQPLYEGSRTNVLSTIMLLVNLKVLNGLSNTCLTQILRYITIYFVTST
jgi:hypothetical protein